MQKAVITSIRNFTSLVVLAGLLAGCAWDNSPPPYHSVINYNPNRSQTLLSSNPTTNTPSTKDWKTNQVVGVGYGSTGSSAPAANGVGAGAVGAASSPSGISTGAGAGTAAPGTGIGTAPAISPTPAATPSAASFSGGLNSGSAVRPQVGTGLGPVTPLGTGFLPSGPALAPGIGLTNSASSVTITNTLTGQTNLLPGLSRPTP
jgi:hypothetical protein